MLRKVWEKSKKDENWEILITNGEKKYESWINKKENY